MSRRLILSAALALGAAVVTGPSTGALADSGAEGAPQPENPLAPFERLVGGAWHLDRSYQVFEWGHDRRIVRATSAVFVEGERKQVSEGFWVWHPLLQDRGDGPELVMGGTFERVEWPLDESSRAGGVP